MLDFLKRKKCPECGTSLKENSNFCQKCGYRFQTDISSIRKEQFVGRVLKCPSCGNRIDSLTVQCSLCGCEIHRDNNTRAMDDFTRKIIEFDKIIISNKYVSQNSYINWSGPKKIFWVILNVYTICIPLLVRNIIFNMSLIDEKNLSIYDLKKASFIKNYVFPNDVAAITEGISYLINQINSLQSSNSNQIFAWANILKNKIIELISKSKIIGLNNSFLLSQENEMNNKYKLIKKKQNKKVLISILMLIVVIIFLTIIYAIY
jgi:hypothetical protein